MIKDIFTDQGDSLYSARVLEFMEEYKKNGNVLGAYINGKFWKHFIKPIETIVVLGCNRHAYSEFLIEFYDPQIIYAFDPDPTVANDIRNNRKQDFVHLKDKVIYNKIAVSDVDGTVDFYESKEVERFNGSLYKRFKPPKLITGIDSPSGAEIQKEKIKVNCTRLDTFFSDQPNIKIDLLCVDIQGAELYALKGLGDLIKNTSYIILEIPKDESCNYHENGYSVDDIYSFLETNGFSVCEKEQENDFEDNVLFARRPIKV